MLSTPEIATLMGTSSSSPQSKRKARSTAYNNRIIPNHFQNFTHQQLTRASFLPMNNTAPLLTFCAANDSTRPNLWDIPAQIFTVEVRIAKPSSNDVLRNSPEAGKDVERATVVAI